MAKINFVKRKREVERMSRKEAREVVNNLRPARVIRVYNSPVRIKRNKKKFDMYTTTWYTLKDEEYIVKWLTGKEICWK